MQCSSCGTHLPEDAQFCIECGADVSRQPNTGATVTLTKAAEQAQVACNACGAANPSFALFCVRCGQRIGASPLAAPPPPVRPEPEWAQPRDLHYSPPPPPRSMPQRPKAGWEMPAVVTFLVGLAMLLLWWPKFIFPGILALVGISTLVSEFLRGRVKEAVPSLIWLFGLTLLFTLKSPLFVPGIIALVGLSILWAMLNR